jgi:hypothetical protein
MSEAENRGLQDEARALLRPAREPQEASAEVRARMLRRLSLALPPGGPGGSGGPGTPGNAGSAVPKGLSTRVPAWSLLASFVAGGAIATAIATTRPAPTLSANHEVAIAASIAPPIAPVVLPPPIISAPVIAAVPITPVAPLAISTPSARPITSSPIATARVGNDGSLEAERALLDVARTALIRSDGSNALRATEEHGRKFPRGILAEEREAMSIQALRLLHRDDEAQARLERFRGSFPSSLIRPALEATEAGAP